jgi:ribosomal protein S18 acetylase RimI-like enzyme
MTDQSKIIIREIRPQELHRLEDFLYAAVYQSDKENLIPRDVIKDPAVNVYIDNFGEQKDDYCLVAEYDGELVGAVWIRILAGEIKGYGNIDEKTPEFATAVFENFQKQGIGTILMNAMLEYMRKKGYAQTSLSVIKENYAVKLYKNAGFEIIDENEHDYLMLLKF